LGFGGVFGYRFLNQLVRGWKIYFIFLSPGFCGGFEGVIPPPRRERGAEEKPGKKEGRKKAVTNFVDI
jgi:hypothetical protein